MQEAALLADTDKIAPFFFLVDDTFYNLTTILGIR